MEQDKCVICLTDFTRDETERIRAFKCNHEFHDGCVEAWLNEKKTCPVCRGHIEHYKPKDRVHSVNSNTRDQGLTGRTYEYDSLFPFLVESGEEMSSISLTEEELAMQTECLDILRRISREATEKVRELGFEQDLIYPSEPEGIHIDQTSDRPKIDATYNRQQQNIDAVNERPAYCGVDLVTGFYLNVEGRPRRRIFGNRKVKKEREPADSVFQIFFVSFVILLIIKAFYELYMSCFP